MFSGHARARELTDLSLEITSTKQGAEAKQDAFDQATEEATRRLTEELIGPEKAAQLWPQIRTKLLKNSTRYLIFIKGAPPVTTNENTKVMVQMRLAPDALEGLLREMGAFAGGSARLLPLIHIAESRGSKYDWWVDASDEKSANLAQEYFRKAQAQLTTVFKGKSVYVLDPTNAAFRLGVPAAYRSATLRREDQGLLGQYLKADVVLSGKIDIVRPRADSPEQRIDIDLQLWQARSLRLVAEVTRSENASSDNPKVLGTVLDNGTKKAYTELATKLSEAMSSGNLNLNQMKVQVIGVLSYHQQKEFRKQLGELREVRSLKERLFEPQRVIYEIETPVATADLAKAVQKAKFRDFVVSVEGSQDDGLVLGVRATSAQ